MILATSNEHRTDFARHTALQNNRATRLTCPAKRVRRSNPNLRGPKRRHNRPSRRVPQALPLSRPVPTRPFEGGRDPARAIDSRTDNQVEL